MALARALTTLVHDSVLYRQGDEFEFDGELRGTVEEGMEWVTPKTTKKFNKAAADRLDALKADELKAQGELDDLRAALVADPANAGIQQQVLDAETKVADAHKSVVDATPDSSDLV